MKNLTAVLMLILVSIYSFGQDKIIKRDLTEILCKVTEIGTLEIKYKKADNIDGPTYSIKKSEILKIVFENGSEEKFENNEMSIVPSSNRNYKRAITTRPFSLVSGHICLGYQQAIHPSRAIIAEIGLIGPRVGDPLFEQGKGGYARIGFRLKRTPEVVMEGMEWGFNLGGVYIQPEIAFSAFNTTETVYDNVTNVGTIIVNQRTSGAFLITFGRQSIIGGIMTFDIAGSIGYGFTTQDNTQSAGYEFPRTRFYSHSTFGDSSPIAWNITLSMGFLLK